jgi:hypothetical protein
MNDQELNELNQKRNQRSVRLGLLVAAIPLGLFLASFIFLGG